MSQTGQKIAQGIRDVAHRGNGELVVMMGICISVDMTAYTAVVAPYMKNDVGETTNTVTVNLNTVSGSNLGLILQPTVNTEVVIMSVDGPGVYVLVQAKQVDKILMNGGCNGGLINVTALITKLNNLENDVNNLKNIFSTLWIPVPNDGGAALKAAAATWAGSTLTDSVRGDIEDTKVVH